MFYYAFIISSCTEVTNDQKFNKIMALLAKVNSIKVTENKTNFWMQKVNINSFQKYFCTNLILQYTLNLILISRCRYSAIPYILLESMNLFSHCVSGEITFSGILKGYSTSKKLTHQVLLIVPLTNFVFSCKSYTKCWKFQNVNWNYLVGNIEKFPNKFIKDLMKSERVNNKNNNFKILNPNYASKDIFLTNSNKMKSMIL